MAEISPAQLLPLALFASFLSACQTNSDGIDPFVAGTDAAPSADALPRETLTFDAPPPNLDSRIDRQATPDGNDAPDLPYLPRPPAPDAGEARDTLAPVLSDGAATNPVFPVDAPTLPDATFALPDTAPVPPDTAPIPPDTAPVPPDTAPVPPDTAPEVAPSPIDTLRPDTRSRDTRRPDPNGLPTPLFDWPIDSVTTLGGHPLDAIDAPSVTSSDPGTVVCFDGSNDGLLAPVNPLAGLSRFTLQLLMRPAGDDASPRVLHIQSPTSAARRLILELRANSDGRYSAFARFSWDDLAVTVEDPAALHDPGQWVWLAVSYDGQTMRLFVNGVEEAASPATSTFGPLDDCPMSLGMRQSGNYFFHGCLARLITSDVALAPADLQAF